MTAKSRVELFVGLFIIIGLVILTVFVFLSAIFKLSSPAINLT